MTKTRIDLHITDELHEMMQRTMKRERQANKTAFVISAIEHMCAAKKDEITIDRIEKLLVLVVQTMQQEQEDAKERHIETKAYLDVLAQAVCETNADYEQFQAAVKIEKAKLQRGAN